MADAVETVLRDQGAGRPMHYRAITQNALDLGLVTTEGLTPDASVNAAITTDIAARARQGAPERFIAYGKGLYGLAGHRSVSGVEDAVRRNNADVHDRLLDELREMDPFAFEDLVGRLLIALGFVDVEVTARSGDGGVDVRGTLAVGGVTDVRTAIQVKRQAKNVPGKTVRELRGGLSPHERGLIISTSAFTRDAKTDAAAVERAPISLVDGNALTELLVEHGIGVVRTETTLLRLDPDALLASGDDLLSTTDGPEDSSPSARAVAVTPPQRRRSGRHPSGKNLALWPLPGGQGNFIHALDRMLSLAAEAEPNLDEFISWMVDAFPTVNSRKSARSYIEVLRLAGLIEPRDGRLVASAAGAAYLSTANPEDLYRTMTSNIAGIDETLDRITQEPATLRELTDYLNELLGISWEGESQAKWRVWWLESFGKATRDGDRWQPATAHSLPLPRDAGRGRR